MTAPAIDPGHLVPRAEWPRIVADSRKVRRALTRGSRRAHHLLGGRGYALGRSSFPSVTGFMQCRYDGGAQPGGKPTFGVWHDAETPLNAGYAQSIASYFTRNTNSTSAHFMLDPVATYQLLDTSRVAWHCGNGNTRSIGVEQAGYASLTPAQWTTAAGLQQMARAAALFRDIQRAHGIGLYWMNDQQLLDAWAGRIVGGWATHHQCSRVLGGSTHTDPDPNYPYLRLMQMAQPPAPPSGGFLMALSDADQDRVLRGLEVLVQQICGEKATIDNPFPGEANGGGWPTIRFGATQQRLSLVMFLQQLDRQLNSALDLTGRPGGDSDNEFGHLLSLRAELDQVAKQLDEVLAKLGA